MSDDNVIDAEEVQLDETPNLPAVVDQTATHAPQPPIEGGRDWSTYSRPERRCTAKSSRTGEQCKNSSILGSHVCRYHGGAAPQVKQAARTRLENAADLMAKQLLRIAITAESEAVKLAAIRDALDRSGLRPPAEVVVTQTEPKPYEIVFDSIGGEPPESMGLGQSREGIESHSSPMPPSVAGLDSDTSPAMAWTPPDTAAPESSPEGSPVSADQPPPMPRPRADDRDRHDQPPARHITGEAAMQAANWANAAMAESHGLPWGESARRRR